MKILSHTIASRNVAWLMLAVWFLVLTSGVANACLLVTSNHGGRTTSAESAHVIGHAEPTAHCRTESSKAPCQKACDEGSRALQRSSGIDPADLDVPPSAVVLWSGLAPATTRPKRPFDAQPSLSEPPARIIYSRWAL